MTTIPSKLVPAALALAVLAPRPAAATLTFTQLDDDVFTVSHRVKVIGSRGKATKMVYTKAASLCMAAGYTHMRILDQESQAAQEHDNANATVHIKLFLSDGEDRMGCERMADPQYIQEAAEKLLRRGYAPPSAIPPVGEEPVAVMTEGGGMCPGGCSLEQIAAMARAGLSDEQIRAACANGG